MNPEQSKPFIPQTASQFMDPCLKELAEASEELISSVSQHPAIIRSNSILKKGGELEPIDNPLDLIDLANKFVAEIDGTIKTIHRVVSRAYSKRFPELDVADPVRYLIIVQILGNEPEKVNEDEVKTRLAEILDQKMVLLVTMTAATTQGVNIEEDELKNIMRACSVAMELSRLRSKLVGFVESNMSIIAPNLSVIVGAPIAAKLMGLAGGLSQLAAMPACNLPVLGSRQVSIEIDAPPRVGLIYECELIQQIPFDHSKDVRKRAVRWVANKCILAARCDLNQSDSNTKAGREFRSQIENYINKELEPPPKKAARPLPAPIEKSGKKRGGKRVRRMKERYGQTELRKAANRIKFGDVGDDLNQDDIGSGRTLLTQKKLKGTPTSTLTLEIQKPKEPVESKPAESSSNYFSNTAGFLNLLPKLN